MCVSKALPQPRPAAGAVLSKRPLQSLTSPLLHCSEYGTTSRVWELKAKENTENEVKPEREYRERELESVGGRVLGGISETN